MNYVATILYGSDSESKLFKILHEAKQWLDENNNNFEHTTFIDVYDENWKKAYSIPNTEAVKDEETLSGVRK